MSKFDEFKEAVKDAEETIREAERLTSVMALMLVDRLRNVSPYTLQKLKKELKTFNASTGKWKN